RARALGQLSHRIPTRGRLVESVPRHAPPGPALPPVFVVDAEIIVGDAILEPARVADLVRTTACGSRHLIQARVAANRAHVASGHRECASLDGPRMGDDSDAPACAQRSTARAPARA